jgi:hypothetical protein
MTPDPGHADRRPADIFHHAPEELRAAGLAALVP